MQPSVRTVANSNGVELEWIYRQQKTFSVSIAGGNSMSEQIKKVKTETGSIWATGFGIISGIILFIAGGTIGNFINTMNWQLNLQPYLTWADFGINPITLYVNIGVTILCGIIAIGIGIIARKHTKGSKALLIFGLSTIVIEVILYEICWGGNGLYGVPAGEVFSTYISPLNQALPYIGAFLLIIGGVIGIINLRRQGA
jgi:hypothetical protein